MSDYLHIKDWFKFRRGEIVKVRTRWPEINGVYKLEKILRSSNFPYRITHKGEQIYLHKDEVTKLTLLDI